MKHQGLVFPFMILIALLAHQMWAAGPVNAQAQTPVCQELEIVIIVDQSGSMPGSEDHPTPNDPNGLRFFAPLRVVRWMGQDFVGANALRLPSRPVITYHMALVDFGDTARVRLPWTTISPATEQDWQNQAQQIATAIAPFTGDLGNTNMVAALQAASNLFQQRATPSNNCPRRAIFMLSDGMPYVKPPDETQHFSVTEHMRQVQSLIQGELKQLGVDTFITAIDYEGAYWTSMERTWKRILPADDSQKQSYALKVNSEDEIGERFVKLLVELTNRTIEPVTIGPRCVPPYLQEIVLTFYKRDPNEHLQVIDPIGPLDDTRTDIGVQYIGYNEPIESLRVLRPLPGKWQITTSAPRADVIIDEVSLPAAGRLVKPLGTETIQYVQSQVQFYLADSQGQSLAAYSDPLFDLSIIGNVRTGSQSTLVSFAPTAPQGYGAQWIPVRSGLHQVVVSAKSQQPRERTPPGPVDTAVCEWIPYDVLQDRTIGQFEVAPVQLASLGAPAVQSGTTAGCPLQVGDQAVVRYQSQRADTQQPVVFSLPVEWEVALQSAASTTPVSVQGPDGQGVFTATVEFAQPLKHDLVSLASVRLPDGTAQQVLADKISFDVKPVQKLQAVVRLADAPNQPWWWPFLSWLGLTPKQSLTQIARDPFWRWLPTEVEVLVSLDGQNPANPTASLALVDPNTIPVSLSVAGAGGADVKTIALVPTNVPGRYRASVPGLGLGRYEIRVEGVKGLTASCGFSLPIPAQVNLQRQENPWIYLELLLVALMILLVLISIYRWRCVRINPCKGYFGVFDKKDNRLVDGWFKTLAGLNTWRLRGNLAPPAKTGIQAMTVRSTRGSCGRDPYENNRIWVQVVPLSLTGKPEPPLEKELASGEKWEPERLPVYIRYVLERKDLDKTV